MRTLMISESENSCIFCGPRMMVCGDNLTEEADFCPFCQNAYWYSDPHPDSPHNTGLSEEKAKSLLPKISAIADEIT